MAISKEPAKIAFMPELQGSEAMKGLIDRIRTLARDNQFDAASDAVDQSLELRVRIAEGYASSKFKTDFDDLPEDAKIGGFLYPYTQRGRT
ncbi:hypothetical protein A6U87_27185 [Rhizobium sp. AC44/96]|jgi:hypothetical protein|uniref:hypothetical protein n=1 Tax=Rhizobium/Agrobacterium group TaxID=227290 RepID=UPI00080FB10C|nr:hypothetical protein [Rhizobium sp. AC44/96]OCJ11430.1 hypothetical protein A6U87_27185 [Rhizobium sp. AC44/96]